MGACGGAGRGRGIPLLYERWRGPHVYTRETSPQKRNRRYGKEKGKHTRNSSQINIAIIHHTLGRNDAWKESTNAAMSNTYHLLADTRRRKLKENQSRSNTHHRLYACTKVHCRKEKTKPTRTAATSITYHILYTCAEVRRNRVNENDTPKAEPIAY